jgi:hypothetical protein
MNIFLFLSIYYIYESKEKEELKMDDSEVIAGVYSDDEFGDDED